jgi:hypothetical protein
MHTSNGNPAKMGEASSAVANMGQATRRTHLPLESCRSPRGGQNDGNYRTPANPTPKQDAL